MEDDKTEKLELLPGEACLILRSVKDNPDALESRIVINDNSKEITETYYSNIYILLRGLLEHLEVDFDKIMELGSDACLEDVQQATTEQNLLDMVPKGTA